MTNSGSDSPHPDYGDITKLAKTILDGDRRSFPSALPSVLRPPRAGFALKHSPHCARRRSSCNYCSRRGLCSVRSRSCSGSCSGRCCTASTPTPPADRRRTRCRSAPRRRHQWRVHRDCSSRRVSRSSCGSGSPTGTSTRSTSAPLRHRMGDRWLVRALPEPRPSEAGGRRHLGVGEVWRVRRRGARRFVPARRLVGAWIAAAALGFFARGSSTTPP